MPSDPSERFPFHLEAHGEISIQGMEVLERLLGSLGVNEATLQFDHNLEQDAAVADVPSQVLPALEDINSADNWVLKEHFFEFRDSTGINMPSPSVGAAFNRLVDNHRSPHTLVVAERYPSPRIKKILRPLDPSPGIVVRRREDLDLPPYKKATLNPGNGGLTIIENPVIHAGSLVEVAREMKNTLKKLSFRQQFIIMLGDTIAGQITD